MSNSDPKVTFEDSRDATNVICALAGAAAGLPLQQLETLLSRAESAGPVLDPTGYREHGKGIRAALKMVKATRKWVEAVQEAAREGRT